MSYTDRIRKLIEEIKKRNSKLDSDFTFQVGTENLEADDKNPGDNEDISSYFVDPNNPFDDPDFFSVDDGEEEVNFDREEGIIDVSNVKPREINFDKVNITTADKLVDPVKKPFIEPVEAKFQFPFKREKEVEKFEMPADEYTNKWSDVEKAFLDKQIRSRYDVSDIPWPSNLPRDIYYDLAYALNKRLIARKTTLERVAKKHTFSVLDLYTALNSSILVTLPVIYFNLTSWLNSRILNDLATIIGETDARWVSKYIKGWIAFKGIGADPVTCEYYGYLKSGIPIVWWDKSGRLREDGIITDEVIYLEKLNYRKSIFMETSELSDRTIVLFTKVCRIIKDELNNSKATWPPGTKAKLKKLFPEDNVRIWVSESAKDLLSSLFKITESVVRVKLLGNNALNVVSEMEELKYQLRPNVYEDIINLLQSYEAEDLLMDEAIRITGSNEKFNSILLLALKNTGEKERYPILFELLTFIEGFEFKTKILNQLFESDDTVTSLISALSLNASGKLKGAKLKKARESVHKTRLASFDELLSKGKNPVLEDLQDIKDLQYIHRKNIKLDLDKIDRSRVELSRVIENVKTIVGTDAEDEPDKNEIQKSAVSIIADVLAPDLAKTGVTDEVEDDLVSDNLISTLEENRIEFIKRVISKEGLKVKEAEEMADKEGTFLSTVIESINNLMYKTFEDQVLLIEGDFVIADEYYKEELTELMNGY